MTDQERIAKLQAELDAARAEVAHWRERWARVLRLLDSVEAQLRKIKASHD